MFESEAKVKSLPHPSRVGNALFKVQALYSKEVILKMVHGIIGIQHILAIKCACSFDNLILFNIIRIIQRSPIRVT